MPVRIALLSLILPVAAVAAEPGPPAREGQTDRNGYTLPPGAVARLGLPPTLSGFARAIAWMPDGSRFVALDGSGILVLDAATGRPVETQSIEPDGRHLSAPSPRDGRTLLRLNSPAGALYDTDDAADRFAFTLPAPLGEADRKLYSLGLSTNHRILVGLAGSGSQPRVAWRFDLAHGRFSRLFTDRADLQTLRLSPDGRRVFATGGTDAPELTARDAISGKEQWTVRLRSIGALRAMSDDGGRLAVADSGGVTVHDAATGKVVLAADMESATPAGLWGIDLSPDGRRLAVADSNRVIVWDVDTGKQRHTLPHPARLVAFAPDGRSLLSASAWVQRWDLDTGRPAYPVPVAPKALAASLVCWSADGRRLLTQWPGDRRGDAADWRPDVLAVWDVGTADDVWQHRSDAAIHAATLDRAGTTIRAYTADRHLHVWQVGSPPAAGIPILPAPPADAEPVAEFLPDGRLTVQTTTGQATTVDVYDPAGARLSRPDVRLPPPVSGPLGYPAPDRLMRPQPGVLVLPDGRRVEVVSGRPLPSFEAWNNFTPDGAVARGVGPLIAGRARDRQTGKRHEGLVWDALTGRFVCPFRTRTLLDWSVLAISPDGRWAAVGSDQGVRLLEMLRLLNEEPDEGRVLPVAGVKGLAFAPDGRHLATAQEDGTILIWAVPAGTSRPWEPAEVELLWAGLKADDAAEAWKTLWHLLDHPDQAMELLNAHLKPVPPLTDTADLIARLDHPRYAVREEATAELARRGESVEGDLRAAVRAPASEEQRTRLAKLLGQLNPAAPPTGEMLRGLRGVWLLERLGRPAAKRLLDEVAGGATGAQVTIEAKAALGRWP